MGLLETFCSFEPLDGGEDFERLWTDATIVFDTNVLLSSLRLSEKAFAELFVLFEALGERIWIPHQVGLEFVRNKRPVVQSLLDSPIKLRNDLIKALEQAAHPTLPLTLMRSTIESWFVDFNETRLSSGGEVKNRLDERCQKLSDFFGQRCGKGYDKDELGRIYESGRKRYSASIPPGFADQKEKSTDEHRFGDLVLWHQIIDYARAEHKDVILVTQDQKEDWWRLERGQNLGPHPKLRDEFEVETTQVYYAYNLQGFLTLAPPIFLKRPIGSAILVELNRYREIEAESAAGPVIEDESKIALATET